MRAGACGRSGPEHPVSGDECLNLGRATGSGSRAHSGGAPPPPPNAAGTPPAGEPPRGRRLDRRRRVGLAGRSAALSAGGPDHTLCGLGSHGHPPAETEWRGPVRRLAPGVLRTVFGQAVRNPDTPWAAFYRRVIGRLGPGRAIFALAQKLLVAAWRVWRDGRLAHEADCPRDAQQGSIRRWMATRPRYPWAGRLAVRPGERGAALGADTARRKGSCVPFTEVRGAPCPLAGAGMDARILAAFGRYAARAGLDSHHT